MLGHLDNVQIHSNVTNLGITKNYQHSFSLCKGEYIVILEGDDYWIDPLKVKKQIDFLDKNPTCVMCAHPFLIQRDGSNKLLPFGINEEKEIEIFEAKDLIMDSAIISNFSTACYRRLLLEKISPATYDVISYEWMINISIAQFGPIGKINKLISDYRISSSGQWSEYAEEEKLIGNINILPKYDHILQGRYHVYFEKKIALFKDELDKLYLRKKNSGSDPIYCKKFSHKILNRFIIS
ncbi:MAG: glycosyltransferase [Ferruginibacter sp.]